ncbi:hypothetical protein [Paenibacillus sp. BK033]|uniref:hypothetical protein n=1 Tax=Paenibacillus sp. BK033 TaxID=2512133 RepID=UPI001047DBE0|nr:hypothetical protein [Paenibacillus sp. BK033]
MFFLLYLDKNCAERLKRAGYKRLYRTDEPTPYDYYEFEGNEWSLGGQLTGEGTILAPSEVYERGLLLPTISDLMNWLVHHDYRFVINYNGNGYRVIVTDENEEEIKGKGGTLPYALTSIVEKLLLR